jgi:CheY-like chemotaxis protein
MTPTTVRLLHVEDDRIQQAWLARKLAGLTEYHFEITVATSEHAALAAFAEGCFDLVILDYHLAEGDGLSCLRLIRAIDSIIPMIAVSGVASDEIAAELITAGADDYLAKQTLDGLVLEQSLRNVLTRAKAFRERFAGLQR